MISTPPRSLLRERSEKWSDYKRLTEHLGRNDVEVVDALRNFNGVNYRYKNYSRQKQGEHEMYLINKISSSPKLFHSYIRRRKKGKIMIGPLRTETGVVSESLK